VYSFLCFRIQNDRKTVKMLLQFFQQRSMWQRLCFVSMCFEPVV
jgi:hypothetical protein